MRFAVAEIDLVYVRCLVWEEAQDVWTIDLYRRR